MESSPTKQEYDNNDQKKQNLASEGETYCIQIIDIIAPTGNHETKVARTTKLTRTSYKRSKNAWHTGRARSRTGRARSRVG